jgi:carotenoid cleavage dioxygenase-like enzyme
MSDDDDDDFLSIETDIVHFILGFAEMDLSMEVLQRQVFTLNEQTMIHDWGLTDNHYVLLANRVKLNSPGIYRQRVDDHKFSKPWRGCQMVIAYQRFKKN